MTTGWLLLLLVVHASSQSVDNQSKNESYGEGGLLSELLNDTERLLDNQQQLFQQCQTIMNRLGKCFFSMTLHEVSVLNLCSDAMKKKALYALLSDRFIIFPEAYWTIYRMRQTPLRGFVTFFPNFFINFYTPIIRSCLRHIKCNHPANVLHFTRTLTSTFIY